MKTATIYTQPLCGFCTAAIRLLRQKGVTIDEHDVGRDPSLRAEMIQKADGARTTPQIWIGDTHVGGCDDLYALERSGKLDALIAA